MKAYCYSCTGLYDPADPNESRRHTHHLDPPPHERDLIPKSAIRRLLDDAQKERDLLLVDVERLRRRLNGQQAERELDSAHVTHSGT